MELDLVSATLGWAAGRGGRAGKLLVEPSLQMAGERISSCLERSLDRFAGRVNPEELGPSDRVAPRVAFELLSQAAWTDDEICVEYISGILASSISEGGQDDRGLPHAALIGRLPRDALLAHMLLYRASLDVGGNRWSGQVVASHPLGELSNHVFEVGWDALIAAVGGSEQEISGSAWDQTLRALHWLEREGLGGNPTQLPLGTGDRPSHPTYRYQVTAAGMDLFLWGIGLGRYPTVVALRKYFDIVWDERLPYIPAVPPQTI